MDTATTPDTGECPLKSAFSESQKLHQSFTIRTQVPSSEWLKRRRTHPRHPLRSGHKAIKISHTTHALHFIAALLLNSFSCYCVLLIIITTTTLYIIIIMRFVLFRSSFDEWPMWCWQIDDPGKGQTLIFSPFFGFLKILSKVKYRGSGCCILYTCIAMKPLFQSYLNGNRKIWISVEKGFHVNWILRLLQLCCTFICQYREKVNFDLISGARLKCQMWDSLTTQTRIWWIWRMDIRRKCNPVALHGLN